MYDSQQSEAFEYVIGTLDNEERRLFDQKLKLDKKLQEEVRFWEESLFDETQVTEQIAPFPESFDKIRARINTQHNAKSEATSSRWFDRLFTWRLATAFSFVFAFSALLMIVSPSFNSNFSSAAPDYVAVLVNDNNEPVVTALTTAKDDTLLLRWENWTVPDGYSLQMWSQSRRDGEIRPLLVFDGTQTTSVELDRATLRLIMDSSHLIMTKEEVGGSAIDMPSEEVLAKGVCVRFTHTQANS